MFVISFLLFLLSLVMLVVGMIIPKKVYLPKNLIKSRKNVGLVYGIVIFISFSVAVATTPPSIKKEAVSTQQKNQDIPKSPEPTPKSENKAKEVVAPIQTPKQMSEEEKIVDSLWKALDSSMGKRDGYDVHYDKTEKRVTLTFNSETFWDEKSLVKSSYTTMVKYGKEAFKINGVESLETITTTIFTDKYGKKTTESATDFGIDKDQFNKFEWDNLIGQPIYQRLTGTLVPYIIHPAIRKGIDVNSITLSF